MNDGKRSNIVPFPRPKDDLQAELVDVAVHKLAAAVSSRKPLLAHEAGREQRSLTRAMTRVLEHFGCAVDEMSLAVATRGGEVETIVRRVCEQHQIYVREVELEPHEARTFAGPVLAFRGGEAVVLLPGTFTRWSESGDRVAATGNFELRAFTFYRGLVTGPIGLSDFWRVVFG